MKKFNIIALALVVIISLAILVGCANPTANAYPVADTTPIETLPTNTSIEATAEELDLSDFAEVDPNAEEAMEIYRNEVQRRDSESFISEEESAILKDSGFDVHTDGIWLSKYDSYWSEVTKYYYPVVFRNGDSLVLWYTTEYGSLRFETISGDYFSNYGGSVHYNGETGSVMENTMAYSLVYNANDGEVLQYEFGAVTHSFKIPSNAVYCGSSFFEGYIFRDGSDVYSLNTETAECICIAHGVAYVIDTDYYYGSDPWCQPLFLMEDGQVLAYIGWDMYGDAPDDPGHLLPLQYEGGYR